MLEEMGNHSEHYLKELLSMSIISSEIHREKFGGVVKLFTSQKTWDLEWFQRAWGFQQALFPISWMHTWENLESVFFATVRSNQISANFYFSNILWISQCDSNIRYSWVVIIPVPCCSPTRNQQEQDLMQVAMIFIPRVAIYFLENVIFMIIL